MDLDELNTKYSVLMIPNQNCQKIQLQKLLCHFDDSAKMITIFKEMKS
mgnify:CR=1 FL=1